MNSSVSKEDTRMISKYMEEIFSLLVISKMQIKKTRYSLTLIGMFVTKEKDQNKHWRG